VTERLPAMLEERRAHDAERDLAQQRARDEQSGSGPLAGSA